MAKGKKEEAEKKKVYRMVPLDLESYWRFMGLVYANGFGKRTQGALVRKLVDAEIEKIMVSEQSKEKQFLLNYLAEVLPKIKARASRAKATAEVTQ